MELEDSDEDTEGMFHTSVACPLYTHKCTCSSTNSRTHQPLSLHLHPLGQCEALQQLEQQLRPGVQLLQAMPRMTNGPFSESKKETTRLFVGFLLKA